MTRDGNCTAIFMEYGSVEYLSKRYGNGLAHTNMSLLSPKAGFLWLLNRNGKYGSEIVIQWESLLQNPWEPDN